MTFPPAILVLDDGTVFRGESFGAEGESIGEVVFNTSMTGYQEILTDPSYKGQMVTMTYPLIGNYGINLEDVESRRPFVEGFIVREVSRTPSNWRTTTSLPDYLRAHGICGISGIDTRALTRHLREKGCRAGIVSTAEFDVRRLRKKVKAHPGLIGRDLVKEVTSDRPYSWREKLWRLDSGYPSAAAPELTRKVVAFDFGIKYNILRHLVEQGCDVQVVPASATADEVMALDPDGIFLSNGPGDPEGLPYAAREIKKLLGVRPIFGICLGHQLLGLALGGKTYKLKFGHHGGNQPVMDLTTKKVEITSQNHNFAVDVGSLGKDVRLTHVNLNDQTVEGMEHRKLPVFSVQYHPEASPGPHDAQYLFRRFLAMMEPRKG
jgi:carbamoyl-phosphate synthase small subunit